MEKYILIAHHDRFVCAALQEFFKPRLSYVLEADDDIDFRIQDLNPACLIYHSNFQHATADEGSILEAFKNIPMYWIAGIDSAQGILIQEPFDPAELSQRILKDLESNQAND